MTYITTVVFWVQEIEDAPRSGKIYCAGVLEELKVNLQM